MAAAVSLYNLAIEKRIKIRRRETKQRLHSAPGSNRIVIQFGIVDGLAGGKCVRAAAWLGRAEPSHIMSVLNNT